MALLKSLGSRFGGRAGLADMLLGGGLGLMSQGPSLTPQSPWQGLGAGLMMGRQLSRGRQEQEREEARMALEREKFAAQQAGTATTAAQQQAKQAATVDALVRGGMDPAQAQSIATAGAAGSYLKPEQQWSEPREMEINGQPVMVQEGPGGKLYQVGGGGVTVNLEGEAAKVKAREGAMDEIRQTALNEAQAIYEAEMQAAFQETNPVTAMRRAREAQAQLTLARQNAWNQGRELSDRTQKNIAPPGLVETGVEKATEWLLGDEAKASPLPPQPAGQVAPVPGAPMDAGPPPEGFDPQEWDLLQKLRREQGGG